MGLLDDVQRITAANIKQPKTYREVIEETIQYVNKRFQTANVYSTIDSAIKKEAQMGKTHMVVRTSPGRYDFFQSTDMRFDRAIYSEYDHIVYTPLFMDFLSPCYALEIIRAHYSNEGFRAVVEDGKVDLSWNNIGSYEMQGPYPVQLGPTAQAEIEQKLKG